MLADTPQNSAYLQSLCAPTQPPRTRMARLSALDCLVTLLADLRPEALPYLSLQRDAQGRPYATVSGGNAPCFDFNLTHSKHFVGCALLFGKGRVGVDIEDTLSADRAQKLATRFFSESEKKALASCADTKALALTATRLWTAREAISKQEGRGFPLSYDSEALPPHLRLWAGMLHAKEASALLTLCAPSLCSDPICDENALPIQWIRS